MTDAVQGDLFDPAKVGVVSVSEDGSAVTVSIAQVGLWTGSDAQLRSLQEKIHSYVGFVLDGQMTRLYPETEGLAWKIGLDCHFGLPEPQTAQVLDAIAPAVRRYGGALVIRDTRR